ncbi:MAG: ABC transporter ATP-binding protein/permease, partial [Mesorhizobium sp.]
ERPREEKSQPKQSPEHEEPAEATPEAVGEPAPPPPESVEPGPKLTPEEAEQARRKYLFRRFWISGRGYWGRNGDKLAWPFTIGLLVLICVNVGFQYGINVWNRAFFDAIEQRNVHTVYMLSAVFV